MDDTDDITPGNDSLLDKTNRQKRAQELAIDMMIHDVRNPLSSIVSIADMLGDRNMADDDQLWLMRIKTLGYRALDILKATSGYTEMERGEYELEKDRFDLLAIIRTALDKTSVLSKSKTLTTQVRLNGAEVKKQSLSVTGDRFFLEQMLDNLLTNALEASPVEKNITIALETREVLRISVHNQGVVPEEKRAEIFDKLASYQQERGSGLGAYLVKLIAEQHNGTVSFTTSESEGTVFRVELPILTL